MYIASPPIRGVGCTCTSRSRGIGDGAEPGGEYPNPPGAEIGDDRGGQPDERELAQRNTRAPLGEGEHTVGQTRCFAHHWMNRT